MTRTSATVRWAPTRLLAARGAACALLLLMLATTFLAAALPRQLDRSRDAALDRTLSAAAPADRSLRATAPLGDPYERRTDLAAVLAPDQLAADGAALTALTRAPLSTEAADASLGVHTLGSKDTLSGPGLPEPDRLPPALSLDWQPGLTAHARLLTGRLPRPGPGPGLEAAVSAATAATLHLRPGSVLSLHPQSGPAYRVTVVGVFAPADPDQVYWCGEPLLAAPALEQVPVDGPHFWHAEALIAAQDVTRAFTPDPAEAYWWHPPAAGSLPADRTDAAQSALADLISGPAAAALQQVSGLPGGITVSSGLPGLLSSFAAQRDATTPVLAIGAAGAAGALAALLLAAGGLAGDRRGDEITLLRARGASAARLVRLVLVETLLCGTAGAVPGTLAALWLLPTRHWLTAVLAAGAFWASGTAVVVLRTVTVRRPASPARRAVAELTAVLLASAAAVSLRRQGTGGGFDPLLSAAPTLFGLVGALVLARVFPWTVRRAARATAGRAGAVSFLGLARAGNAAAGAGALALAALLLALGTGGFGAAVLGGVATVRADQARDLVGADASVTGASATLPGALVTAVRTVPGVESVVAISEDPSEVYAAQGTVFEIDGVDPAGYAALSARVGAGMFDPALLDGAAAGDPVPVLASPGLAAAMGAATTTLDTTAFGPLTVRVVGTLARSLANPYGDFLIVPQQALPPLRAAGRPIAPQALLLTGPVDGPDLRAAVVRGAGRAAVSVRLASDEAAAALAGAPLQRGAERLYLATVAAAAVAAVLAVLLSLLHAAPQRAALLARLRTMGLTPGQSYRLVLVEALPQLLLGTAAGLGLGLLTVPLLGSSVDLSALAGGAAATAGQAHRGLPPRTAELLPLASGLLVLTVLVAAVEGALGVRRTPATELRAGDRP